MVGIRITVDRIFYILLYNESVKLWAIRKHWYNPVFLLHFCTNYPLFQIQRHCCYSHMLMMNVLKFNKNYNFLEHIVLPYKTAYLALSFSVSYVS